MTYKEWRKQFFTDINKLIKDIEIKMKKIDQKSHEWSALENNYYQIQVIYPFLEYFIAKIYKKYKTIILNYREWITKVLTEVKEEIDHHYDIIFNIQSDLPQYYKVDPLWQASSYVVQEYAKVEEFLKDFLSYYENFKKNQGELVYI